MKISVIIPVYNNASIIVSHVSKVISVMQNCGHPFEILLINDGSTDGSDQILSRLDDANIQIFTQKNQGLGSVLSLGFSKASGHIIVILDLDLSYDIFNMYQVIDLANHWDCVVCSKYKHTNNYPFKRRALSVLYFLFCKWILNISVRDMGSGFVMLHSKLIRNESFICKGFGVHCELFLKLQEKNAKILEIPINYTHSPGSFRLFYHSIQTIKELTDLLINQRKQLKKRP